MPKIFDILKNHSEPGWTAGVEHIYDLLDANGKRLFQEGLNDPNPRVKLGVAFTLAETEKSEEIIRVAISCLGKESPKWAAACAMLFKKVGKPAVNHLVKALESNDALVMQDALAMLSFMGSDAVEAIPAIEKLGKDRAWRPLTNRTIKRIQDAVKEKSK